MFLSESGANLVDTELSGSRTTRVGKMQSCSTTKRVLFNSLGMRDESLGSVFFDRKQWIRAGKHTPNLI
jgi:hypothetical protein